MSGKGKICPQLGFIYCVKSRNGFLYSLANNVAAQSSNLGIVSYFIGAIFDVEHEVDRIFCYCCL
jgi:hypothetical protein